MVSEPGELAFAGLPDLQYVDLKSLLAGGANPHLAAAAKRVVAALDDPDGIISAFQSFIKGDDQS